LVWKKKKMSERRRWIFLGVPAILVTAFVFYVLLKMVVVGLKPGAIVGEGAGADAEGFKTQTEKLIAGMTETPGATKNTATGRGAGFKPCEVYFTDNMKTCRDDQYRFNRKYYEAKLATVRKAVNARGGAPTAQQNDAILTYTRMLSDYDKIPSQRYCKISLPNWKSRTDDPVAPFVAKNVHNKDRGTPQHWAYCWRESAGADLIGSTGMKVEKTGGRMEGKTFNGVFHIRGTFDEAMSEGVIKTYCAETKYDVKPYVLARGFVIKDAHDPAKRRATFYKNDKETTVSEADAMDFFARTLLNQEVVVKGGIEEVFGKPVVPNVILVKIAQDPCGKRVFDYRTLIEITFTESIPLSKTTINPGSEILRGTTYDLEKRIIDYTNRLANFRTELNALNVKRNAAVANRNSASDSYNKCRSQEKRWNIGRVGTRGSGGEFDFECPDKQFIRDFYIRSGPWVNQISPTCNGGRGGGFGDWGGVAGFIRSWDGFSRIEAWSSVFGDVIMSIFDPRGWLHLRTFGWQKTSGTHHLNCGSGKIVGIYGRAGPQLSQFGIKCGAPKDHNDCASYYNSYLSYHNAVIALDGQIWNKQSDIRQCEAQIALMRARLSEMRTRMKEGINRFLRENKISLRIPNEATEPWRYLSYDNTYITEL